MDCCEAVVDHETPARARPSGQAGAADGMTHPETFRPPNAERDTGAPREPIRQFIDHIAEFSSRKLSYEGDILDAFRGLLSRSQFFTYYGTPLIPLAYSHFWEGQLDFNIAFAWGLLWEPKVPQTGVRRVGFPSWSWVGWKCPVDYNFLFAKDSVVYNYDIEPRFMVEDSEGKLCDFNKLISPLDGSTLIPELSLLVEDSTWELFDEPMSPPAGINLIPELSPFIVVDATVYQFRFQETLSSTEMFQVCSCHPNSGHEMTFGDLGMETFATPRFDQAPKDAEEYQKRLTTSWDCIFLLETKFTTTDHPSYSPGVWVDSNLNSYSHGPDHSSDEGWSMRLMIVEWVGDVAYRVGLLSANDKLGWEQGKLPSTKKRVHLG